ncbi:MAG: alpha/beta fold hydrolase, partial [Dehalococcoidia bacterium]|nr:alpha/beta fold hydrolase [Dehalococcoidia bacterium]
PTTTYPDALQRFAELRAQDGPGVNPVCRSVLLAHGQRTARVVVLIHGMTNCPAQFATFGQERYHRGDTVLIPRMPHNGLANRMTTDLRRLTAPKLRAFADTIVDIATGLGEQVTVVGLSVGGTVAAWIAQHRVEVASVVAMGPAFAYYSYPPIVQTAAMIGLRAIPDVPTQRFRRWADGPPYSYFGFSTHAIAASLQLAHAVQRAAARHAPKVRRIGVMTTGADDVVNNDAIARVIRAWRQRGVERLEWRHFPAELGVLHDMIDPHQGKQQIGRVYPVLHELIDTL